ncbi:hypothetical protein GCM10009850_107910 [Nonomuraea monospora]|uniref:Peptidase S53 domain-containing protein n=1 Tax=Nonomuraea monospora TaxID=568818 RepID=A0ABN3D0L0_9ACTN
MRLRRLMSLAAAVSLGIGVFAASPAHATPRPTPSQTAEPAPGIPAPDYTPVSCNRSDLPEGHARCLLEAYTPADARIAPRAAAPRPTALTPEDIRSAYKLPDGGEGQTVAIVDAYGYAAAESDLAVFRKQYGLSECTTANGCFRKVDQRGGTDYPPDDPGWAAETMLDLDAVSAVCPRCKLLLVEADTASAENLSTAVETAVALGAKYVSNSYGIPGEADGQQAFDKRYQHPGVVVTASTGDTGNLISWPASNPSVVAVGGTKLTRDASTARGWTESPWTGGGSGCSRFEPRPLYQEGIDTNCPSGRATADISADADPASGLSVYHSITVDGRNGWLQYGGTSLSAPLVAAMYALAGTPAAGTDPVTYPYASAGSADLFDITEGGNGVCGNVLCEARPGWDGPTGLGTPNGVAALTFGPAGTVTGRLTDQGTGAPVTDGTVTARNQGNGKTYYADAGDQGEYTLLVPAGAYDLTVSRFGYAKATRTGVVVPVDQKVTADVALQTVPSSTVSGTITGDADHAWPLAASISIDGYPHGEVTTDPRTGRYTVELPRDADYTFRVSAAYPGYTTKVHKVSVGGEDTTVDTALTIDRGSCLAPGYAYPGRVDFEGWTGTAAQDGWTVAGTTPGWEFLDKPANLSGGSGDYGAAAPFLHDGVAQDTYLTSPAMDFSGQRAPEIRFTAVYFAGADGKTVGDVELSLDGGATWTIVGHPVKDGVGAARIAIPQAAGKPDVRVRFHYAGAGVSVWELDDLTIGSCAPLAGGLVSGVVTDANTGEPVPGATVGDSVPSAADGRYWLFAGPAGKHKLTASANRYTSSTGTVTAAAEKVTGRDWSLRAGKLSVSTTDVSIDATLGRPTGTRRVRLTNTGGAPLKVTVGEHTVPAGSGAVPQATAWTDIADYPLPVAYNVAGGYEGKIYSVGGITPGAKLSSGYVYDPAAGAWSPIADLPQPLSNATGIFLDGTMYVVGGTTGQGADDTAVSTVYAYHPDQDAWTRLADLPTTIMRASVAALGKQLYVVGGCVRDCAREASATAYRYDVKRDTWTAIAGYPAHAYHLACAGVSDRIICAGGRDPSASGVENRELIATFAYSPRRNTWTRLADLPYGNHGMAYSGANGKLQIAAGMNSSASIDQAVEYDPVSGAWHVLPKVNHATHASGSACGLYKIGGMPGFTVTTAAEVLPGYDSCGGDDVSWLKAERTEIELAPGRSTTLSIKAGARVSAPGRYGARLSLDTDAPYAPGAINVTMQVKAPHHR